MTRSPYGPPLRPPVFAATATVNGLAYWLPGYAGSHLLETTVAGESLAGWLARRWVQALGATRDVKRQL